MLCKDVKKSIFFPLYSSFFFLIELFRILYSTLEIANCGDERNTTAFGIDKKNMAKRIHNPVPLSHIPLNNFALFNLR